MATKFSDFTAQAATGTTFVVGYDGTTNTQYSQDNLTNFVLNGNLTANANVGLATYNLGFTNGKVGVGLASPLYTFETRATVAGNWVARIMNESNTGYGLLVRADNASSNITFATHNGNGYTTAFHGTGQVGINTSTNTPSAQLHIKGSGTASTTSFLVENSSGVGSVKVIDDGQIKLGTTTGSNNLLNQEPLQINSASGSITNYIRKSGGSWRILNFTGGEPYMTVTGSSAANVTFGTGQVLVNSTSGVHYKYGAAASAPAFAGLSVSDNSASSAYPAKAFQNARITSTRIADKITNNGIGAASGGLQVFDTTTKKLQYWNESAWVELGGADNIYTTDGTINEDRVVTVGLGAGNNTYTTSFESTKNNGTAERNSSGNILQIKETYTGQTPVGYSQTRGAILKLRANTSSGSLDTEGYVQAFIINSGSSDYTTRDQMGFRTNKAFVFKATDTSWPMYFAVQGGPSNNLKTLIYSGQQDGGLLQLKANNAKTTKITFADTSALPGTNGYYRYISGGNTGDLVLGRKLSGGSEEAYVTMSGVGGYAGNIAVGVNQGTPTATLHVTGSGATNATTALLVEDGSGNDIIKALDDRTFGLGYNALQITNSVSGNESVRINDRSGAPLLKVGVSSGSAAAINMCNGYYNTFSYTTVGGMVYTNAAGVNVSQDAASMFTLISTTKGMLPPRMTTTQRDAINSGTFTTGLTLYNTTDNKLQFYNGTAWTDAGGGGDNIYTADGTLGGARTVSMDGNNLTFSSASGFPQINSTKFILYPNGNSNATNADIFTLSGRINFNYLGHQGQGLFWNSYNTSMTGFGFSFYGGGAFTHNSGFSVIGPSYGPTTGAALNARLGVIGKSATSTTDYAFRVQDSAAADMLTVRDDGAIAIGKSASYTNSTPNTSVIIGTSALVTSNNSVVIGASATTGFGGNYNTVVGAGAKVANNTSFGLSIGYGAEGTGTNSVAIGYSSKAGGNGLAIGRDAEATGSKSITLSASGAVSQNTTANSFAVYMSDAATPDFAIVHDGNSYITGTGNFGFGNGNTSPTATVDIDGTFRLRSATNVNGKVLTADANGNGTWQTAGGGSAGPAISIENTNGGDVDLYDDNIVRLWLDDGSSDDIELEITNYASSTSSTYHVNYTNFEGGASSARTTTVDLNQSGATSISTLDFSFTDDECMKLRIWSPRLGLGVGGESSGFPFYEITIVKSGTLYTGAPVITSVIKSTS